MWIQVRSMDGKQCFRIDDLSKLSKIEDLRKLLVKKFDAPVSQQRLFYRGKQLEDGHTLFDYDVGLNDIIQLLIRHPNLDAEKESLQNVAVLSQDINKENEPSEVNLKDEVANKSENMSKYFKVGDLIDGKDATYGAWFEAKIVEIKINYSSEETVLQSGPRNDQAKSCEENLTKESDGLIYRVAFEDYENVEEPVDLSLRCIRPRARKVINFDDIKEGDKVMVNYNIEDPKERGFWYDCRVTGKKDSRTMKQLIGSIIMGPNEVELDNCKICFTDEIFAIENNEILSNKSHNDKDPIQRSKKPHCSHCKDSPTKNCKQCSCHKCGGKDEPDKQIICDECDFPYHLWCLQPPLSEIPAEDEWYCPKCKNDETEVIRAGEKLKASKKKSKMVSANSSSSRDWGKGMACIGRTTECTIVPPNHFGPIPGVEVGTMWKFRMQVSESGVHRPHVAGIHGREGNGAFSIVLSGGYEDDLDEGDEFKYTGSGGRDLSGNKRCAEQSCDQTLTRMNKALALNCNVALNNKGAESKNWKEGKPVRVVRNFKGRKHSKYCPEEGNRYDGIYKVIKYWPEKGKSGFLVWRYLLRRDDPSSAPWTKAGKKRIEELGLTMQYPEGYLESLEEKEQATNDTDVKKKKKRESADSLISLQKKKRKVAYTLPSDMQELIEKDTVNKKTWDECLEFVLEGSQGFLKKVEDSFLCICCQELVYQPITTNCFHNLCKGCLERSFKAEVYCCPMCRQALEKSAATKINQTLHKILHSLFPGYDAGR